MRRIAAFLFAFTAAAVAAGCSEPDDSRTATSVLESRTVDVGEVTVEITPLQLDSSGATFLVAVDTHSVDLTGDLAASSTLSVGGTEWQSEGWDGAEPGGHHRQGELRFAAAGPAKGQVTLIITGLPEPVEASWDVGGD